MKVQKKLTTIKNCLSMLSCFFFGHTIQRGIIEDNTIVTRYYCTKCGSRMGHGLKKDDLYASIQDKENWKTSIQNLVEDYKNFIDKDFYKDPFNDIAL